MNIAILSNNIVENVIVADSIDAALNVIGDADMIVVTDATGPAYIGGDFYEGRFREPRPYPSWEWNNNNWEPSTPYPSDENIYLWNENQRKWELLVNEETENQIKNIPENQVEEELE